MCKWLIHQHQTNRGVSKLSHVRVNPFRSVEEDDSEAAESGISTATVTDLIQYLDSWLDSPAIDPEVLQRVGALAARHLSFRADDAQVLQWYQSHASSYSLLAVSAFMGAYWPLAGIQSDELVATILGEVEATSRTSLAFVIGILCLSSILMAKSFPLKSEMHARIAKFLSQTYAGRVQSNLPPGSIAYIEAALRI